MISLRASHVLLVMTSALLAAAFKTYDPVVLALAVASVVFAGLLVGQARSAERVKERARR